MTAPVAAAPRVASHRRNDELDAVIAELADVLAPAAAELARRHPAPSSASVLVVGCPRAGTTVALQWLVATGALASPSNIAARFPTAPWLGATVDRLLHDPRLGFGAETTAPPAALRSDLGKTTGASGLHELWYAWRRLIPPGPTDALDADRAAAFDRAGLRALLGGLEAGYGRPVALKALILDWNVGLLAEVLPRAVFLRVRRHPVDTMASIWLARCRHAGSPGAWWSFRPPDHERLLGLPPADQIAGLVGSIDEALDSSLPSLGPGRSLSVDLADLVADPAVQHDRMRAWLGGHGIVLPADHPGPRPAPRPATELPSGVRAELEAAWARRTAASADAVAVDRA